VQLQGASRGILVTLGSADGAARDVARKYGVEVIDGGALWPKVQDYVPANIVESVRQEAAELTKRGQWIGAGVSVLVGIVLFAATFPFGRDGAPQADAAASAHAATPAVVAKLDKETQRISDAAEAMAAVAKMSEAQLAARRVEAAGKVSEITQVGNAGWPTQSTLSVNLNKSDGQDIGLTTEVCRILTQYEELRYTRVQLDPPMNTQIPVRWRQCQ